MDKRFSLLIPLLLSSCAAAQDSGARPRPQETRQSFQSTKGVRLNSPEKEAHGENAARTRGLAAPSANSSVTVIGEQNGPASQSASDPNAALPGLNILHNLLGISTGTPIRVRLQQTVDSGHAHNGDAVRGVLAAPLGNVPSGTPVSLTVVASAAAGQISSSGTLSLQVVSVNGTQILSQVITAEGKEGSRELPDAAPEGGTEAVFTSDQPISIPAA